MSKLDQYPLTPVSNNGVQYLGTDSRPEYLSGLVTDPAYQNAASAALARAGRDRVVSIPVSNKDFQNTMTGLSGRNIAPLQFSESRTPLAVPDVTQAAINNRIFGMGIISTFKSDKPQSGINFLRKEIPIPADMNTLFGLPSVGPYNTFNPNASLTQAPPTTTVSTLKPASVAGQK